MADFDEIAYCQRALLNCERFKERTGKYDAHTVEYWENRLFVATLKKLGCEVIDNDRGKNRRTLKTTGVRYRT